MLHSPAQTNEGLTIIGTTHPLIHLINYMKVMPKLPNISEKTPTVLVAPKQFYRHMFKRGGFLEPGLSMIVIAILVIFMFLGFVTFSALGVGIESMIFSANHSRSGKHYRRSDHIVNWEMMATQEPLEVAYGWPGVCLDHVFGHRPPRLNPLSPIHHRHDVGHVAPAYCQEKSSSIT